MGEIKDNDAYEEELIDYEEEDEKAPDSACTKAADSAKKGYVGIHSSGFRDFLLKPELLRSIVDSGFEHPSEVNTNHAMQWNKFIFALAKLMNVSEDESQLSAIARKGSGSACRSLFGGFVKWIMGKLFPKAAVANWIF
ncbi:DEAD-box ATP-dependent RNA helicase 15 isoform X2 [Gossypium hirsutum]|uniref:DEAD-box ATP-dependent RNA helicase 15 isoform X2 n=2 Tax=Gossypium TaxID=3633 RepID=A0A1U8KB42_GOSHI|nr:DEAD-box ATP-dependent RNA helicase 15 isoform X2 [Gossypium hirsutum]TYH50560.1 hypothetical protein ES332_D10G215400v1 [Gossypium tomentosum]TYH50562.1 hypothetical protein ES332_D10G215400v1 [Gossypium tomentosum]